MASWRVQSPIAVGEGLVVKRIESRTTSMKSRQIHAMAPEQTMGKKIADKPDASGYEKLVERPSRSSLSKYWTARPRKIEGSWN